MSHAGDESVRYIPDPCRHNPPNDSHHSPNAAQALEDMENSRRPGQDPPLGCQHQNARWQSLSSLPCDQRLKRLALPGCKPKSLTVPIPLNDPLDPTVAEPALAIEKHPLGLHSAP